MLRTAPPQTTEPVWDLADLFPHQGAWTEDDYLELETARLIEFSHGHLEVLPMPTEAHQFMMLYLYQVLRAFLEKQSLGKVLVAPLRVRLWPGKYREPDVIVMLNAHTERRHQQYWDMPDLVMEVVSPENRHLDLEVKRREYAQANIAEYWIVDQEKGSISVLALHGEHYLEAGVYEAGAVVRSVLLDGFEVAVTEVWDAAKE